MSYSDIRIGSLRCIKARSWRTAPLRPSGQTNRWWRRCWAAARSRKAVRVLEVRSIEVYRGSSHVLRNFSLEVGKAQVVCLVGRNGAGKTTTLETIMGFLLPRSGSIYFHDEDLTPLPTHKRAACGLGYSPEHCGVFTRL